MSEFIKTSSVFHLGLTTTNGKVERYFPPFLERRELIPLQEIGFLLDVLKAMDPSTKYTHAQKFACSFKGFTNPTKPIYELC